MTLLNEADAVYLDGPAQRVYLGDTEVWSAAPPVTPTLFDDFNRADGPLGPNWTNQASTQAISHNAAIPTGGGWCQSSHNTPMPADNMEVSITLGAPVGVANYAGIFLGANATGQAAMLYFDTGGGRVYLGVEAGWGFSGWGQLASAAATVAAGDTITLRRLGKVYTALKNGIAIPDATFTDNSYLPRDDLHRLAGIVQYPTGGYWPIDTWQATDLSFSPTQLPGLQVWLDASTLAGGALNNSWPDLSGGGHDGLVYGSPPPTVRTGAVNGLNVVRFKPNEGKINGPTNLQANGLTDWRANYTVIYVTRMVGPTVGRAFGGTYPDTDYLIGFHPAGWDCYFNTGNRWVTEPTPYPNLPTPWRMYSVSSATATGNSFYVDGVHKTTASDLGRGLSAEYNLSGYDKGNPEKSDCEVAEVVIYNRGLTDTERIQVETYLRAKWF